jgi:hypothetical protein
VSWSFESKKIKIVCQNKLSVRKIIIEEEETHMRCRACSSVSRMGFIIIGIGPWTRVIDLSSLGFR